MILCRNCGFQNKEKHVVFCMQCGDLINGDSFQNKQALHECQKEIADFINQIQQERKHNKVNAPIAGLQKLFDNISNLKSFLGVYAKHDAKDSEKENAQIKRFINECDSFLNRDSSFQIAFAGTIKAGKSTLINAMLKDEYASTSVTPETAVLTKFKYGPEDKITIHFYNNEEWSEFWQSATKAGGVFLQEYNQNNADSHKSQWVGKAPITESLNKEALKKYTSSKSPSHYFAKEVVIELQNFPFQKNIVFVDTPGLDDAVDYRSKVTREYINRANAVLLCVESTALTGSETQTIYRIFDNTGGKPEKVYVLGTKYENLNKPREDWEKQKTEWSKYLTSGRESDMTKFTKQTAEKNIFAVSGYISYLLDLYEKGIIGDGDKEQLENASFRLYREPDFTKHIKGLREFSNVDAIHERIQTDIYNKAEQEVIDDTKTAYNTLNSEVEKYFRESMQGMQESFEASQQGIEAINEKIAKEEEKLKTLETESKELEALTNSFKQETDTLIKQLNSEIDNILKTIK